MSFTQELGVFDQLVALLCAFVAKYKGVTMFVELTHDGAYLKVKLALVSQGLHFLRQYIFINLVLKLLVLFLRK